MDHNVRLSKSLSWLLRHGAEKEGFTLMKGGFLYLDDILKHKKFRGYSISDIEAVVKANDKQRFALETDAETGKLKIRANQGHSLQVESLELREITDPDQFPVVVHGTNHEAFHFIRSQGLSRMNRNHVHFAAGEPGENGVISGMRQSCSVIVYVSIWKAMQDGFKFFQSANGVILCPGNDQGLIPTQYFTKVIDRTTRQKMAFDKKETTSRTTEPNNVPHHTSSNVTTTTNGNNNPPSPVAAKAQAETENVEVGAGLSSTNLLTGGENNEISMKSLNLSSAVSSTMSADALADELEEGGKRKRKGKNH